MLKKTFALTMGAIGGWGLWVVGGHAFADAHGETKAIYLKTGAWDPVHQTPSIPAALMYGAGEEEASPYFLIQFHGTLSPDERAAVEALGAELLFYLHQHAYIARLRPGARRAAEKLPFVRWLGPLQPGHKLAPDIGRREFKDPARRASGVILSVVSLFPGEDAEAVASHIRDMGGLDVMAVESSPRLSHLLVAAPSVEALHAVARIPAVQWVDEEGELAMRNTDAQWVAQTNVSGDKKMWTMGLRGENQIVGVIDGYLAMDSCYFRDPVNNTPSPTHRKVVACRNCSGTDSHGTHVAGTVAGDREPIDGTLTANGHAYKAKITFADVDAVWSGNLYNYLAAAHADGGRIHTNSWGNDGTTSYDQRCVYIDQFSYDYEESAVLFAVSNQSTLRNPENARNVLAVGATAKSPNQHNHCSGGTGPTADGRRKPEIYLPGCSTVSASTNACGTASLSGTSMASPAVAGSLALVRQYFTEGWYPSGVKGGSPSLLPSGALLRAMGLNSAVDMTGVSGYPNNQEGWGRMLLDNVLHFEGETRKTVAYDVPNPDGLLTNDVVEYPFTVESGAEFLRVTLVYTDYPAALNATFVPVNDLDLELVTPSGAYKGNVFSGGVSVTGGSFDTLNNVEQIHLPTPSVGAYTARIIGRAVNQNKQGYALVITGDVATCPKPAAPTLSGSAASSTSVNLSWTSVPEADSYNIYRSTASCTSGWSLLASKTGTTHTDGGLTAGNTYYYVVRAVDNDCESLNSNCVRMLMATSPVYQGHVINDSPCNGNGVPDPGETVTMPVTLRNDGALAATNVSATLSTTTPGITITVNAATFPNIPGLGTAESNAPHYVFEVASSVPCGTFIDFSLAVTSAEGNWNRSFQVMVGSGQGPTLETATQSSDLSLGKDTGGTRAFTPQLTPSSADSVVFTSPSVAGGSGQYQIHVVSPSSTSLMLKSCSATLAATYDITAFYNGGSGGPGQWSMCVSRGNATTCATACSGDTGAPNTRTFSGAKIDVLYNPATCEAPNCGGTGAAPDEVPYPVNWTDTDALAWPSTSLAGWYNVYRGDVANLALGAGSCRAQNIVGTTWTETESPNAGATWFYLVSAENSTGEGPLGVDSDGQPRAAATPCP